jgi:excisionase family DNA binding protein
MPSSNGSNRPQRMTANAMQDFLRAGLEEFVDMVAARTAELVVRHLEHGKTASGSTPQEGLLDVRETAAYLSLAASTIYKLSSSGRLSSVKMGGRLRFRRADLDAYVAGHRRGEDVVVELAKRIRS